MITDAAFQAMIRDDDRVKATWLRIKADVELRVAGAGMDETWDSVKRLIPKKDQMREIYAMEESRVSERTSELRVSHRNSSFEIFP